jgi:hypothetical protein
VPLCGQRVGDARRSGVCIAISVPGIGRVHGRKGADGVLPSQHRLGRYGLLLALFVALRLMMLATFPADNLTLFGDYPYYYELAAFCEQGALPYIHYWSEYPPLFPFLSVGLYRLSVLLGGGYHIYVTLLGLVMLGADTGNLLLVLRLAERLYSAATAERIG